MAVTIDEEEVDEVDTVVAVDEGLCDLLLSLGALNLSRHKSRPAEVRSPCGGCSCWTATGAACTKTACFT